MLIEQTIRNKNPIMRYIFISLDVTVLRYSKNIENCSYQLKQNIAHDLSHIKKQSGLENSKMN